MATLVPHRTLWLGSVAQSLGFGFRLAFAKTPPELEKPMQEALRILAWTGATPGSLLMAQGFADKVVDRVVYARKEAIDKRHAIVTRTLRSKNCVVMQGIPYIWFRTPSGWRADAFHAALLANGVSAAPAAQFAVDPAHSRRGVRLSAAPHLSAERYEEALKRVADVAAHPALYKS